MIAGQSECYHGEPVRVFGKHSVTRAVPAGASHSPSRRHATPDTIAGMDDDLAARCRLYQTITPWLRLRVLQAGILFGLSRLGADDLGRIVASIRAVIAIPVCECLAFTL